MFQHHSLFSETLPELRIIKVAASLCRFSADKGLVFLAVKAFILSSHSLLGADLML